MKKVYRKKGFGLLEIIISIAVLVLIYIIYAKNFTVSEKFTESIAKINGIHSDLYNVAKSAYLVTPTETDVRNALTKYVVLGTKKTGVELTEYCNTQDGISKGNVCNTNLADKIVSGRKLFFDVITLSQDVPVPNATVEGTDTPYIPKNIGTNKISLESCIETEDETLLRCIVQPLDTTGKIANITIKE